MNKENIIKGIASQIKEAEKKANATFKTDMEMDVFQLDSYSINDKYKGEDRLHYLGYLINEYPKIKNIYKASNESFHYLNSLKDNQMNEDERIEFVAINYASLLENKNTPKEVLSQLDDLFNVVFDTQLLKLKSDVAKKIINRLENIIEDKKTSSPQREDKKTDFKDFFVEDVDVKVIAKIQNTFKDIKTGKQLAILIYLLEKKYELIIIDRNSKTESTIHFVRALKNNKIKTIQGINCHFESITGGLKKIGTKDTQYISINEKLNKIVGDCSTITNN